MEGPHSLLPITGNLQYQQPQGGAVVNHRNQQQERKPRPQAEQALKCPRCASTNTKFCYYNNYSLSQPRYFCKGCRRYWTQGGSLRNVPVGGGCRKNKRSSSSSSFCSSSSKISKSSSLSSDLNATNANKAADSFTAPLPSSIPPVCNNLAMAFADNIFLLGHATANTATATNPCFLDVLTSAAASSSTGIVPNTGGLMSSLYFGAEQEGPLMSFEGGGGGGGGVQERALEERVREPNSSWQGLVMNGSLMEGTRMDMPFSALGDAYSFF